jgi:DNA-binding transcriptional LysR family regulator
MNLRQLQTLITIADAGGFASAAGRLHLSQPAASRQIQALEAELGVLLFDRVGRRLQLTSEGEDIVRRGRHLLQEADSLRDRADALKGGLTGMLRVGASPQNIETVLAPFVARFRSKHPGIEVHFVEDGGARISDRLAQGDMQIVLTSVGNALFLSRLLYPAYALAVVAPSHPLGRRGSVDVSELKDEPLLLLHRGFGSRGWFDAANRSGECCPAYLDRARGQWGRCSDCAVKCQHSAQGRQGNVRYLSRYTHRALGLGRLGQPTVLSVVRPTLRQ